MDAKRNSKGQFVAGLSRGHQSQEVKDKISKANSGKNNGMYSGGHPTCKICGIKVSYQSNLCLKHVDRSYLFTPEIRKKHSITLKEKFKDETKHPRYKGENAGYVSKHRRAVKHFGKPCFCEGCGTEEDRRYEWANISGEYKDNREDWLRLCVPCHRKFDDIGNKVWKIRKSKMQT